MPSTCAVPNCKFKKDEGGKVPSTFQVPKDEVLRSQWAVAIPGITNLKSKQRICEKHFEEHFLIKEYVKYDASGNIIAKVPFARARLQNNAIPTIFTTRSRSPLKMMSMDHTYSLQTKTNSEQHPRCVLQENTQSNVQCTLQKKSDVEVALNNAMEIQYDNVNDNHSVVQKENIQSEPQSIIIINNDICSLVKQNKVTGENQINVENNPDCTLGNESVVETSSEEIQLNIVETEIKEPQRMNSQQNKENCAIDTESQVAKTNKLGINAGNNSNLEYTSIVFDSICFKFKSQDNDINGKNLHIRLPKPWNVNKIKNDQEESLLFTYIVKIHESGNERHILEKAVKITADRDIKYEVYSMSIDNTPTPFPSKLKVTSELPNILKKFKDSRVCKGITAIDLDFAQDKDKLKRDIYSNFRHKNCSVLSINSKRCQQCKNYSKLYLQKIKRMKSKKELKRYTSPKQFS